MNRREWLWRFGGAGALFALSPTIAGCREGGFTAGDPAARRALGRTTKVAFVKTSDHAEGVRRALELLDLKDRFRDRTVFLKPNFNSADAFPGSTHNETLRAIIGELREMKTGGVTIGDRSGMGVTRDVMTQKEIFHIAKDEKVETVIFDDLKDNDWQGFNLKNSHWKRGFAIPKNVLAAETIVQTCCLKTHRYGGHFTLSLKNSVGLAAKRVPNDGYNYMSELHSSPNQRRMIAEINAAYEPQLVILDGVEAFTTGGPDTGTKVAANVVIAGTDRIAVDAVGVAVLRHFGTTDEVSRGSIFEQEQIAEAVRLGLGVEGPEMIEILTDGAESRTYANDIRTQFRIAETQKEAI